MGPSSRTRSFVPVLSCHVSVQIWFPLSISEGISSKGWMTKWPFGIFGKQTWQWKISFECPMIFGGWHQKVQKDPLAGSGCRFLFLQNLIGCRNCSFTERSVISNSPILDVAPLSDVESWTELLIRKRRWDKEILSGYPPGVKNRFAWK